MPIPFILAGIAVAAGGYGVKKGVDAKRDYDDAKMYSEWANNICNRINEGSKKLKEFSENEMSKKFENIGAMKVEVYQEDLKHFKSVYDQIKNKPAEILDNMKLDGKAELKEFFASVQETNNKITDLSISCGGSIAGGALAGLGAYSGASLFAAASTGTAISSLSGAAATNAIMAWFGGGSLAAGGFGMAGGAAVLGGIVAGPAIAIGGAIMAAKAETAKNDAKREYHKMQAEEEKFNAEKLKVDNIYKKACEFYDEFNSFRNYCASIVMKFSRILIKNSFDYKNFDESDKKLFNLFLETNVSLKTIFCDTSILTEKNELNDKIDEALTKAKNIVSEIKSV